MASKAMTQSSDSHLPDEIRPALALTDFGLMEIESDDAPLLTLTPAARQELEDDGKAATAAILMAEFKRYPGLQLALVECFKQAYQAYDDYETAVGLTNVQSASKTFTEACEAMFFQLKGIFDLATRETSL